MVSEAVSGQGALYGKRAGHVPGDEAGGVVAVVTQPDGVAFRADKVDVFWCACEGATKSYS